jgi:hypothetical protein
MDSAAVLNAVAVVGGALITALLGIIGVLLGKILGNTNKTVDHVANSHVDAHGNPINLRDDLDEKFDGMATLVKGVSADVGGIKEDLRLIRRDQSTDRATAAAAAKEAAAAARAAAEAVLVAQQALENTQPKHTHPEGEPE